LPAVGFSDVSGVEELIVDQTTGLLVDAAGGAAALAQALARIMGDASTRTRMGDAAVRHVERWKPSIVLRAWEELLVNATEGEARAVAAAAEAARG
jgi:glycosyltransferase involved in cell wall biosynthesis